MKRIFFAATLTALHATLFAQFNQFNSTNLLYNPAFAGSLIDGRLSLDNRIENIYKKELDFGFYQKNFTNRYYAGYDQYSSKLKGGIGVYVTGHNDFDNYQQVYEKYSQSDTILYLRSSYLTQSLSLNLIYAPKIKLSEKFTLSPSIKIGLYTNSQIEKSLAESDGSNNIWWETEEDLSIQTQGVNASLGILLNTEKFYFGISTNNSLFLEKQKWHEKDSYYGNIQDNPLDTPIYGMIDLDTTVSEYTDFATLPNLNIQTSYTFKLKNKDISITPSLMLDFGREIIWGYGDTPFFGGGWNTLYGLNNFLLSTNVKFKKLETGIGFKSGRSYTYKNYDNLIGMLGYNFKNLRLAYSIASSRSLDKSEYYNYSPNHEISLRYLIK